MATSTALFLIYDCSALAHLDSGQWLSQRLRTRSVSVRAYRPIDIFSKNAETVNWEVTSGFEIGGWFDYTQTQQQQNGEATATILNSALTFAFPDLGAEDNLGGIIIGVPPMISAHQDHDLITTNIPLHIEALYRIKVNDDIEITPAAFVIINPDTEDNNTVWITTIRTEFSF